MKEEVTFPLRKQQGLENILIILTILLIIVGVTFIYLGIRNMGDGNSKNIDPVKTDILRKIDEIEFKLNEIKKVVGESE